MAAKGEGIITLDASGFGSAVDEVNRDFDKLEGNAAKALNKVESESRDAERAIDDLGDSAGEAGRDMLELSVNVIGLGEAVGGVTDQIFAFDEKLIALERSKFGLEQTTLDLTRSEQDLKLAMAEGNISALELSRTIEDLKLLRKDQAIEIKEVAAEEKALQGELANFGLSLAQTGFFGFNTFNQILSLNQKQWIAAKFAQIGFNQATIATTFSMKGLRNAMNLVSKHPLMTVAMVAATAGMAAYEANVLGLRDTLSGLAGVELPTITGLMDDLMNHVVPEGNEELTELDHTIAEATKRLEEMTGGATVLETAMSDLNDELTETASAGKEVTGPSAAKDWERYWKNQQKNADSLGFRLAEVNGQLRSLRSSGFSVGDVKAIALGTGHTGLGTSGSALSFGPKLQVEVDIPLARQYQLQKLIIDINRLGAGGGNALTLENTINGRNISSGTAGGGTAPTMAGFIQTELGLSRVLLETVLDLMGNAKVQGDKLAQGIETLLKQAGHAVGGDAQDAISLFNLRSGGNFANADFKNGGGFISGAGTGAINRKSEKLASLRRRSASINDAFVQAFGMKASFAGYKFRSQRFTVQLNTNPFLEALGLPSTSPGTVLDALDKTGVTKADVADMMDRFAVQYIPGTSGRLQYKSGQTRTFSSGTPSRTVYSELRTARTHLEYMSLMFKEANRRIQNRSDALDRINKEAAFFSLAEAASLLGTGQETYQDDFIAEFMNDLFSVNQATHFFSGKFEGLSDSELKALLLKESGALNYRVARQMNDQLAFRGLDRLALVRA